MVESEAATQLALRTAASFDHAAAAGAGTSSGNNGGRHLDDPAAFSRLATAVKEAKYCRTRMERPSRENTSFLFS